jgi:hypothetical protein
MADFIKINGIYVPTPASFDWQMSDLDASSERSAAGLLIREPVRRGVRKISFNWNVLKDMQKFYDFINMLDNLPAEFELEYPDANGNLVTKIMYRGDVTANMYKYANNKGHWKGLRTSFIEI